MRAEAAAEGASLATVTPLSPPASTIENGAEVTACGSDVVATDTVLLAPAGPLVIPSNVIRSASPAFTNRPEKSAHWTARPTGFEQLPTSTPRVTSRTVAPAQPVKVVPVGKVTSMRLLAAADEAAGRRRR